MLLISEHSQAMREDQYGHLCAFVCQQELARLSVCVCQLCNSAVNVIKQVLYCGCFLISKAFAVCYESVFVHLYETFLQFKHAEQTVNTAGLRFFSGGRIMNFEPPGDVVKPA